MSKFVDTSFMRDVPGTIEKIDATDPNNLSNKILSEEETRKRMYSFAQQIGCYQELRQILDKADMLMRNCSNQQERADIGKIYAVEIFKLLDSYGELYVNGQLTIKR